MKRPFYLFIKATLYRFPTIPEACLTIIFTTKLSQKIKKIEFSKFEQLKNKKNDIYILYIYSNYVIIYMNPITKNKMSFNPLYQQYSL